MLPRFGNNGPDFGLTNGPVLTAVAGATITAAAPAVDIGTPVEVDLDDSPLLGLLNTTLSVTAASAGTVTITYFAILPDSTEVQIGNAVQATTSATATTLQGFVAAQLVILPPGPFDFQVRAAAATANVTALTVVPTLQVISQRAA
jgi:hypothetical protein